MVKVTELTTEYIGDLINLIKSEMGENKASELKNTVENLSQQEEILVCIEVDTNKVIGYAKTTTFSHGILSLDYIYVAKDYRRDTNGSIILVAVYNRAINRLMLGIVAKTALDNAEGIAFLKARGFIAEENGDQVMFSKSLMHMYKTHPHD